MKKTTWVTVWLVASVIAVHGVSIGHGEEKMTPEAVKKETGEALDAAKQYTLQQKEEYRKIVEAELNDLSNKIAGLKDRAAELKGDALKALEAQTADLKNKQKAVEDKLKELQSSTAQTWEELKAGLDNAVKDLKKSYEKIVGEEK